MKADRLALLSKMSLGFEHALSSAVMAAAVLGGRFAKPEMTPDGVMSVLAQNPQFSEPLVANLAEQISVGLKFKPNTVESAEFLGTLEMADDLDISAAAKTGKNELEIEVTNLWVNRMIGDDALKYKNIYPKIRTGQPLPADSKRATYEFRFRGRNSYTKTDALRSSGLIGPVLLSRLVGDSDSDHMALSAELTYLFAEPLLW